jgi:hypothetical protein
MSRQGKYGECPGGKMLDAGEWAQIYHHASTCDLPETSGVWLELGRQAGFANAVEVYADPTGFYRLYRYDR